MQEELYVVIHLYQGVPEDLWVTKQMDLAEEWRTELDNRYDIKRDIDGEPIGDNPHVVLVLNSYRYDLS